MTVNAGYVMRAWYDITSFTPEGRADAVGLAGFSQGGAVALSAGLRLPERLAGILALSSHLPFPERLAAERSAAALDVPILMCHGRMDPVVHFAMGTEARDTLKTQGHSVEWHEYPMQHEVCAEELAEIGRWLSARLAGNAS